MIKNRIRLIVADIDGCLSKGSTNPIPLNLIERLVQANEMSRRDPTVPAVTFCTGRPQPYVECLIQATGGYMPALCEGGTVFFDPIKYEIVAHPNFGPEEEKILARLKTEVARRLIGPNVQAEAGKLTHITLILKPPLRPADLVERAREIADEFGGRIVVETTRVCVHLLFRDLHKGTGVEWLAAHTGIAPHEMGGVGDARPDLPFLKMMGLSCAPANAHQDVKELCNCVSGLDDAEATLEFLDQVIAHNRALEKTLPGQLISV